MIINILFLLEALTFIVLDKQHVGLGVIIPYSVGNNVTQESFDVIHNFGLVFRIRLKFRKFFQTLVKNSKKI